MSFYEFRPPCGQISMNFKGIRNSVETNGNSLLPTRLSNPRYLSPIRELSKAHSAQIKIAEVTMLAAATKTTADHAGFKLGLF